jgi:hypothetical protein
MLSNRINRLDELQGLIHPQVIEVLRDVLGQPNGRLRHRGPLILEAPSGGDYGDNEIGKDSVLKIKGKTQGTLKWAKATESSRIVTDTRTGQESIYVKGRIRDNMYGDYLEGNQEVGKCQGWFCSTDTGPIEDFLVSPQSDLGDGGDLTGNFEEGDIFPVIRDIDDVGVAVGGGFGGGRGSMVRHAQATGDWEWVAGYTGLVGRVQAVEVNDIFGAGAGTTVNWYFLLATEGGDPNVHSGRVFQWTFDQAGNRSATGGYLDSKIGKIDWVKPGVNIPRGWLLYAPAAGRFLVGFGVGTGGDGSRGGSNYIQLGPHAFTIYGRSGTTGIGYAQITIQPTTLSTEPEYTGITKTEDRYLSTKTAFANISVPAHNAMPETFAWVDNVGGCKLEGTGQTNSAGDPPHVHGIEIAQAGFDPSHEVAIYGHRHTITPDPHYHDIQDQQHAHQAQPDPHTHGNLASGHAHGVTIEGQEVMLAHDIFDNRPAYLITRQIIRVGPGED